MTHREKASAFSAVLSSFAGGAMIGSAFGIPGVFLGGVVCSLVGYLVDKKYGASGHDNL